MYIILKQLSLRLMFKWVYLNLGEVDIMILVPGYELTLYLKGDNLPDIHPMHALLTDRYLCFILYYQTDGFLSSSSIKDWLKTYLQADFLVLRF